MDTHTDGPGLQRARGFISVGHDEYWTREMYDNAIEARDAGVNFAFLCGNSVFGVVPLLPSAEGQANRIIRRVGVFVGEKGYAELDEQLKQQIAARIGNYPPGPDGALLMGGRMGRDCLGGGDWVCSKPAHWLYHGTGMKEGVMVKGLIGWEWHGEPAMDLPGMERLASVTPVNPKTGKPKTPHAATIYDGPKGTVVFNAGTIWWAQGLSSPPGHVLPAHKAARPQ
ncbi:MAG: N,N-dimethylformamidase beta subunit family domain-containing protein, partial [Candidatus Latescibacterota bacterium]|nr:N,N-dimethylformamidase beta subunit family domain-containing protein [Candidatus Latescibacterota bacterium]